MLDDETRARQGKPDRGEQAMRCKTRSRAEAVETRRCIPVWQSTPWTDCRRQSDINRMGVNPTWQVRVTVMATSRAHSQDNTSVQPLAGGN
jgi:hypothetical protein